MPKSLLEQLPDIVANGRKEAEKILESIESRHRVTLQTREVVLPAKDSSAHDWITAQARQEALARHSREGGNPVLAKPESCIPAFAGMTNHERFRVDLPCPILPSKKSSSKAAACAAP